jgi:hypothetical protein
MNLISCDSCGVVLDGDKLKFPEDIYDAEGAIDTDKAAWTSLGYEPKVLCPVCKSDITLFEAKCQALGIA